MSKLVSAVSRVGAFRNEFRLTLAAFVVVLAVSLKYPLILLALLTLGLAYCIYRIIKDRKTT
jgi:hypothetical protein